MPIGRTVRITKPHTTSPSHLPQPETLGTRQARLWRNRGTSFWIPGVDHAARTKKISTRATKFPAIRPGRHSFPGLQASPGLYERNPCSRLSAFGEALFPLCINTVYLFNFVHLFWSLLCLVPCPILICYPCGPWCFCSATSPCPCRGFGACHQGEADVARHQRSPWQIESENYTKVIKASQNCTSNDIGRVQCNNVLNVSMPATKQWQMSITA